MEDVWFIHSGVNQDAKNKMTQALTTLNSGDYFWPIQGGALGEVLVGPFENKLQAEQMAREVNRLSNMPVWTVNVSSDVL